MVAKAIRAVSIKWLKSNLFAIFPERALIDYPPLKVILDHLQKLEDTSTALPVRGLEYDEAIKNIMTTILSEIDFVVKGSSQSEAYARCVLSNILVCCMAEEKRLARSTTEKNLPLGASATPDTIERPTTPATEPAELSLRFETILTYPVLYKDEKRTLSGIADYSLWHGDKDDMGTNLIIVEAKRLESFRMALVQVVCYMGMVHASRLASGKRTSVVYGICSDGESFKFCRIDNEGVLSNSKTYEWVFESHQPLITSFTRYIIRAAMASSPTRSPAKGRELQVALRSFTHVDREKMFGLGIGNLAAQDVDDEEMEVVHLPDLAA